MRVWEQPEASAEPPRGASYQPTMTTGVLVRSAPPLRPPPAATAGSRHRRTGGRRVAKSGASADGRDGSFPPPPRIIKGG